MNYVSATSTWLTNSYTAIKSKIPNDVAARTKLAAAAVLLASAYLIYNTSEETKLTTSLQITATLGLLCAVNQKKEAKESTQKLLDTPKREDALIKTIIDESKPQGPDNRETVFLVVTKAITKNALPVEDSYHCQENIRKLATKYKIEWVRAGTLSEITDALSRVKKIRHLILATGGNGDMLALTDSSKIPHRVIKYCFDKTSFPNLAPNATILLTSPCSLIDEGIGQYFSELFPKATILGSANLTDPNSKWPELNK